MNTCVGLTKFYEDINADSLRVTMIKTIGSFKYMLVLLIHNIIEIYKWLNLVVFLEVIKKKDLFNSRVFKKSFNSNITQLSKLFSLERKKQVTFLVLCSQRLLLFFYT